MKIKYHKDICDAGFAERPILPTIMYGNNHFWPQDQINYYGGKNILISFVWWRYWLTIKI